MWGQLFLERTLISNYQFGFPTDSSLMILNLSHWQYWWWFWFITYLILYWFIILRIFRYRTLAFKPRIATTFRPHGKWGDLIVCLIPVSWCLNILNHSNMLLRSTEWQTENSLFDVRIIGRQWFWIYKYELKVITDIMNSPKNVGRNKWEFFNATSTIKAGKYLKLLQVKSDTTFIKKYWTELLNDNTNKTFYEYLPKNNRSSINNTYNLNSDILLTKLNSKYLLNNDNKININIKNNNLLWINHITNNTSNNTLFNLIKLNNENKSLNKIILLNNFTFNNFNIKSNNQYNNLFNNLKDNINEFSNNNTNKLFYSNHILKLLNSNKTLLISENNDDYFRWLRNTQGTIMPLRIIKLPLINQQITNQMKNSNNFSIFKIKINNDQNTFIDRFSNENNFFIFQQNRIKKKKNISIKNSETPKYLSTINFPQEYHNLLNKNNKKIFYNNFLLSQNTNLITLWNINKENEFQDINNEIYDDYTLLDNMEQITSLNPHINNNYLEINNKINEEYNVTTQFKLLKQLKKVDYQANSLINKRMLRTKKVLVLPAHINITLITNSYDVNHSWFIPALGVKLDCIPGRSTHHILHIENVGLYYGQCAEICGRYHHHMPIRICALPFDHFLIWWHSFGLPKLMFTNNKKKFSTYYGLRKYTW